MQTSFGYIACVALALGIAGCTPATPPANGSTPGHNSQNSLDWAGTYRGTLPCADCQGIETAITLHPDGRFRSQSRYLGKDGPLVEDEGRFTWDSAGGTVTLTGTRTARFRVGENRLTALAQDGSVITGNLADHYVLAKLGEGPAERYWKLVELNGQPVPAMKRQPYFILRSDGARVTGFGGCNNFTGSYTLDTAASRINFGAIAMTRMACPSGMDVEKTFGDVLGVADNYSLNGDTLTLNRARMAPLARFEAAYVM